MGGFPAARITDMTAHGGIVTVGCPTVLIGNLPASRIGDMHTCPAFTGPIPHVGGPFVLGAFTVLVGNVPQSRVTDMLICIGPPDTLVKGAPNVLVGMVGAAGILGLMLSGLLAGLENFLSGYPKEVLVNGQMELEYNSSITVQGSLAYQQAVMRDLTAFLSTPTGQRWLAAYQATGHHITIAPIPSTLAQNNGWTTPTDQNAAHPAPYGSGAGSDSVINYNPSMSMQYTAVDGSTQTAQPNEVLGHEMIHGLHNAEGDNLQNNVQPSPFDNEEESQTIGTNGHQGDPTTERTLEQDNGQSPRPDHSASGMQYQDQSGNWYNWAPTDGAGPGTPIPPPPNGAPNH